MNKISLLDCTLRDGGYVNDWKFGFNIARDVIKNLVKAKIDVVEVGFLRNIEKYDPDITVANKIEELNTLLPEKTDYSIFSAMAMRSNYDINKLSEYSGHGIEMIRITMHDYDLKDGLDFAKAVKDKGYKLSINPINIMGYTDDQILWIVNQVNSIQPFQFSIVDTFGSMKRRDLDRIVGIVDNNLDKKIRVALHLHENMSLSCCLAQNFLDKHLNRDIAIDGSLIGMGRIPGNLPIELIADYINDYQDGSYEIDYLLDAIQNYIAPIRGNANWGYTPAYFLSAKYNLHRNYSEHFLKKGDLTCRDINNILASFDKSKKTKFDAEYADQLYGEYQSNEYDDTQDYLRLKQLIEKKKLLILAPGKSLETNLDKVKNFISKESPIVISVNFVPEYLKPNFVFFGNNRRFEQFDDKNISKIITSNIHQKSQFKFNFNKLKSKNLTEANSFIMLINLLKNIELKEIYVAGADGYSNEKDYSDDRLRTDIAKNETFNSLIANELRKSELKIHFVTPSLYEHA